MAHMGGINRGFTLARSCTAPLFYVFFSALLLLSLLCVLLVNPPAYFTRPAVYALCSNLQAFVGVFVGVPRSFMVSLPLVQHLFCLRVLALFSCFASGRVHTRDSMLGLDLVWSCRGLVRFPCCGGLVYMRLLGLNSAWSGLAGNVFWVGRGCGTLASSGFSHLTWASRTAVDKYTYPFI
ncbi:hypothetical protein N657DRAFT_7108 [Parathielavia appendiculata]|uniref:Transmembrane protein n=1 Tax=Parathielavia appendiculata TaxID=2587402 RepID=A0AAN6U829_9PEZI|nr:hypothetical protein N657DRAFT_7108 [Parathielavia appendiculata]